MNELKEHPLFPIVNPRSIAFFGGSNNFGSMGTSCLASLISGGFQGPIYPIHPKEKTVQGLAAFQDVADLPQTPDLAVMVLPTRLVVTAMEACGKKGIKSAVVVTAGFREVGGEGVLLEKQLKQTAEKYGIRFMGPNCIGVANTHHGLNTTFMPMEGKPGFIGLASQSGSFVTQMFDYLDRMHLGFSTAFSVGNGASVDPVDCMEYLGACPHTKVIALYIEALDRGREFLSLARKITPHKPIVALYVGGSETGKKACFSHTGSMGGPDRLYDGMFAQAGIIRARSLVELFDFSWVLGSQPLPEGNGVAILTHSGGPGASAADACGREGLSVPRFSEATRKKLDATLPHTASRENPVDVTFSKNPRDFFQDLPQALLEDTATDMVLAYYLMPEDVVIRPLMSMGLDEKDAAEKSLELLDKAAEGTALVAAAHDKPLAGYTFRGLEEPFPQALMARGVPVFSSPERAARAFWALARYAKIKLPRQAAGPRKEITRQAVG